MSQITADHAMQTRKSGDRRHLSHHAARLSPMPLRTPENAFDHACQQLYPKDLGVSLATLFAGKAMPETIRDWRRGRGKAPQWACDILHAELEKRRIADALAQWRLAAEKEKAR